MIRNLLWMHKAVLYFIFFNQSILYSEIFSYLSKKCSRGEEDSYGREGEGLVTVKKETFYVDQCYKVTRYTYLLLILSTLNQF